MKNKNGFTLIELLVVISIIGMLSTVVLVSLSSARSKARDTRRRQDIATMQKAVELYFNDNGNYLIAYSGSGSNGGAVGCGCGWLSYRDTGVYAVAISQKLNALGYLGSFALLDPFQKDINTVPIHRPYMYYPLDSNRHYVIMSKLENPTAQDTANINRVFSHPYTSGWTYPVSVEGMNYVVSSF